jgi:hypothetical protein
LESGCDAVKEQPSTSDGLIINDKDEFMCAGHDTPRNSEWCEENCPKYYHCDTIAWVGDELKAKYGE